MFPEEVSGLNCMYCNGCRVVIKISLICRCASGHVRITKPLKFELCLDCNLTHSCRHEIVRHPTCNICGKIMNHD